MNEHEETQIGGADNPIYEVERPEQTRRGCTDCIDRAKGYVERDGKKVLIKGCIHEECPIEHYQEVLHE